MLREDTVETEWDAVNSLQGGSILGSHKWLALASSLGMEDQSFAFLQEGKISQVFPVWVSKALNYRRAVAVPFGVAIGSPHKLVDSKELRSHLKNIADVIKINSFHSQIPLTMKIERIGTGVVIQTLDSEEGYKKSISPRLQKYIRSAERDPNIVCETVLDLEGVQDCWNLYMLSMKFRNSPGSMTQDFLTEVFRSDFKRAFILSKNQGTPNLFLVLIGLGEDAFAIATGVDRDTVLHSQTPHLINFSTNWARENGFRRIHLWGGLTESKSDELMEFKLKYGIVEDYSVFTKVLTIQGLFYSILEKLIPANTKRRIWSILRS